MKLVEKTHIITTRRVRLAANFESCKSSYWYYQVLSIMITGNHFNFQLNCLKIDLNGQVFRWGSSYFYNLIDWEMFLMTSH